MESFYNLGIIIPRQTAWNGCTTQWQRSVREVHGELTDPQQISKFESTYYSGGDVEKPGTARPRVEISGQASVVEAEIQGLETAANYSDIIFL